jgi:flagellar biogenesis protein FliO
MDALAGGVVNPIAAALFRWFASRQARKIVRIVDQAPLFGGAAVHVFDVDARRFVIATSPATICLLAQFERACPVDGLEGAENHRGEMSYCGCARARPDVQASKGDSE